MRIVCALAAGLAVIMLAGCGGESESASSPSTSVATNDAESSEHFTVDNWDLSGRSATRTVSTSMLASEPDGHKGASVVIGKIFQRPERDKDGVYFQMYADPAGSDGGTVTRGRFPPPPLFSLNQAVFPRDPRRERLVRRRESGNPSGPACVRACGSR